MNLETVEMSHIGYIGTYLEQNIDYKHRKIKTVVDAWMG